MRLIEYTQFHRSTWIDGLLSAPAGRVLNLAITNCGPPQAKWVAESTKAAGVIDRSRYDAADRCLYLTVRNVTGDRVKEKELIRQRQLLDRELRRQMQPKGTR